MQTKLRISDPSALFLFSFFLLASFSNVKADPASPNLVEAQAGTQSASMNQADAQSNTLSAAATGVSTLPEVTVTGKGIDQAAAFDEMHDSLNKVNVLSQDQINQTPAKTVAEAAQEFPGVGIQHDTGEPRYIDIRGTDSNFNIITYNETIIPSYDEASRSVDLDDIPAGLFGEYELFKTILPNMDAQGVGGQLNLVPKTASQYPGGLFELKAEGEYFPERNQPGYAGQFTWADTYDLGGKTKLGILVTAQADEKRFGIDDAEDTYTGTGNGALVPYSLHDFEFRYYDYDRFRAGIGTNIDLSMDRDNKLYADFMYSGYDEYRDPVWHTVYHSLDALPGLATVNADGSITLNDVSSAGSGVDIEKDMSDELTQFRTLATGVGGSNNLGGFILDYKASFAYTDQNQPWNYGYEFDNANPTGSLTYNNSTNNGNSPSFNFNNLQGQNNASQFIYDQGNNDLSIYNVAQYGLKADGKFDTPLGGDDNGTVKFGAAARWEYSTYWQENLNATLTSNTLTMSQVLDPNSYTFYPGGIYNMGPVPGVNQTTDLLNNPNIYQSPYGQTDPVGDQGGDYNNWEDVYAGYAMYTLKTGNLTTMAGVRVESTAIQYNWWQSYYYQQGTTGPLFTNYAPGLNYSKTELSSPIAHTGDIDYTDVLPSLGFKLVIDPTMTTRLNYSETIARPTQNQYIPSFSLGQALSSQLGDSVVNFTYGNPNLQPMISNNFDYSWEFYPQKASILAVDGFVKLIDNYFAQNYSVADNTLGLPTTSQIDSITYTNLPNSQIYGVEFQYQQQYTMLPGFLKGFGFRGAISFIGSRGELTPGVYGELPSQSDLIWNTGIFFKSGGFTFDIGGSFTGKNLTNIGDPAFGPSSPNYSPNIYYDDYFQIDAKAQYALSKDFTIYADGNNLNNADLRYYQASSNYPIQNEYYQPSFDLGVDMTF